MEIARARHGTHKSKATNAHKIMEDVAAGGSILLKRIPHGIYIRKFVRKVSLTYCEL
jgi:hypothetical protein